MFYDFHPLFVSVFVSFFMPPPLFFLGYYVTSLCLCMPRLTPLFLFYIFVFLPLDGKKKISFSVLYSFPIRVLWDRFDARNVRIQRSLFLEKF